MSKVLADSLQGRATGNEAPDFPKGATITGVCTATSFSGNVTGNATGLTGTPSITVQDIVGVGATFSGVLTYEDVTNVDSVGIVTARLGVRVLAGGIQVVGLTTVAADGILVGTGASIFQPASNTLTLGTNNTEAFRIDSSQRIVIGAASQRTVWGGQQKLSIEGTDGPSSSAHIVRNSNDASYPYLVLGKSRGTSDGSSTIVQVNDVTGLISFNGADGGDMNPQTAYIESAVDGTPGTNDMPGRLSFYTTAEGAYDSTERMRITKTGGISLNNGELIERCNISSNALNSDTAINLDNGMVHYRTTAIGAASVKPNIYSSVGINTQMATGDIITVTIITACSSTSNFVDHIMVDYKDVTENWVGGSAPTDGGGSGVDTYSFNIIKTASETFTVIGNHVKTS